MNNPVELRYTASHEWVREESDGVFSVGITDHAQEVLGDLVFIELPEQGKTVAAGQECAVVESVKAASDVYAPLSGEIVGVNTALNDHPDLVNQEAYEAWMFKIKVSDASEWSALLDAQAYQASVDAGH
jgi:glycine cleavage system H protein